MSNRKFYFIVLILFSFFILLIKCVISYKVFGSNDITYWLEYAKTIYEYGPLRIYSFNTMYNHPPLVSWVLVILFRISKLTNIPFPFIFRLPSIIADFFAVIIIWNLLKNKGTKKSFLLSIIAAANPINFLISSYHGNVDPIFILFLLLSMYLLMKNRFILSGISMGISISIKIVPLLFIPSVILYLLKKKGGLNKTKKYLLFLLSILGFIFIPYLIGNFLSVFKNIFLYNSLDGRWGIGLILRLLLNHNRLDNTKYFIFDIYNYYNNFGPLAVMLIITSFSYLLNVVIRKDLIKILFLVLCVFFTFTSGFGVQYLTWISYFFPIVMPFLGTVFITVGGIFLFETYQFWEGTIPPYYANSIGNASMSSSMVILSIILWLLVIIALAYSIFKVKLPKNKNLFFLISKSTTN